MKETEGLKRFISFIACKNRNKSALVRELLRYNSLFVGQLYADKSLALRARDLIYFTTDLKIVNSLLITNLFLKQRRSLKVVFLNYNSFRNEFEKSSTSLNRQTHMLLSFVMCLKEKQNDNIKYRLNLMRLPKEIG